MNGSIAMFDDNEGYEKKKHAKKCQNLQFATSLSP